MQHKFIGRQKELDLLKNEFEQLSNQDNSTRIVSVVAESGLGKTRLLQAFYTWLSQTHDENDPNGYWPDYLAIEQRNLRINPDMKEYAQRRDGLPVMPFLWWGVRGFEGSSQRNYSEGSKSAIINAQYHLHLHFGLLKETERGMSAKNSIKRGAVKVAAGLVGFGALGDFIADSVGLVSDGKDVFEGIKSTVKEFKKPRNQSKKMTGDDISQDETLFSLEEEDRPEVLLKEISDHETSELFNDLTSLVDVFQRQLNNKLPLIILIDDAHWIDEHSLDFFKQLILHSKDQGIPLLLITTHWEQEWKKYAQEGKGLPLLIKNLSNKVNQSVIKLNPISDMSELVKTAAPGITFKQRSLLLEKAAGNPLLLNELLHFTVKPRHFNNKDLLGTLTKSTVKKIEGKQLELHTLIESRFDELEENIQNTLSYIAHLGDRAPRCMINCVKPLFGDENIDIESILYKAENPHSFIVYEDGIVEFPQKTYQEISYQAWKDMELNEENVTVVEQAYIRQYLKESHNDIYDDEEESILSYGLEIFPLDLEENNSVREKLVYALHSVFIYRGRWKEAFKLITNEQDLIYACAIRQKDKNHLNSLILIASTLNRLGRTSESKELLGKLSNTALQKAGLFDKVTSARIDVSLALGEEQQAIKILEESSILESTDNKKANLKQWLWLARIYRRTENLELSKHNYKKIINAISSPQELNDNDWALVQLSEALGGLGYYAGIEEQNNEAEKYLLQAIDTNARILHSNNKSSHAVNGEIQLRGRLSDIYKHQKRFFDAVEILRPSIPYLDSFPEDLTSNLKLLKTYCVTKGKLAQALNNYSKLEEALQILNEAILATEQFVGRKDISLQKITANIFKEKGRISAKTGAYHCAINMEKLRLNQLITVASITQYSVKDRLSIASASNNLYRYSKKIEDKTAQVKWLKKAFESFEYIPKAEWNYETYSHVSHLLALRAEILSDDGNYTLAYQLRIKAAEYERETIILDEQPERLAGLAITLNRLATYEMKLREFDQAQANVHDALNSINKAKSVGLNLRQVILTQSALYGQMSLINQELKKPVEAIEWRRKEIALLDKSGSEVIGHNRYCQDKAKALARIINIGYEEKLEKSYIPNLLEWFKLGNCNKGTMPLWLLKKIIINLDITDEVSRIRVFAEELGVNLGVPIDKGSPVKPERQSQLSEDNKANVDALVLWVKSRAPVQPFRYGMKSLNKDTIATKAISTLSKELKNNYHEQKEVVKEFAETTAGLKQLSRAEWGRWILQELNQKWYQDGNSTIRKTLSNCRAHIPFWGRPRMGLINYWIRVTQDNIEKTDSLERAFDEIQQLRISLKMPPGLWKEAKKHEILPNLASLFKNIADKVKSEKVITPEFLATNESLINISHNMGDTHSEEHFKLIASELRSYLLKQEDGIVRMPEESLLNLIDKHEEALINLPLAPSSIEEKLIRIRALLEYLYIFEHEENEHEKVSNIKDEIIALVENIKSEDLVPNDLRPIRTLENSLGNRGKRLNRKDKREFGSFYQHIKGKFSILRKGLA